MNFVLNKGFYLLILNLTHSSNVFRLLTHPSENRPTILIEIINQFCTSVDYGKEVNSKFQTHTIEKKFELLSKLQLKDLYLPRNLKTVPINP